MTTLAVPATAAAYPPRADALSPSPEQAPLRVLIVASSLPFPPNWGAGMRNYQILRHLRLAGHAVTLLTYTDPNKTEGDIHEGAVALQALGAEVRTVPFPQQSGIAKRCGQALSLLSPRSFSMLGHHSARMQAEIDALVSGGGFDLVFVEMSQMACFDFSEARRRGIPVVLDEHNVEYELLQRMAETERSPVRRLYNGLEFRKCRREEVGYWRRLDGTVITSPREAEIIRAMAPGRAVLAAPNGVDVEHFRPGAGDRAEGEPAPLLPPDSVVMTGLMRYRPNDDAALFFASEVLPRIHKLRPGVTFAAVGNGPTDALKKLAGPHVKVTGLVPDVRPYLADAAAIVVPVRMGSGTRLKVLEGLAMGKPMISTSIGCEGIDVRDGEHLLIADDPDAFAAAVVRVLDDAALASRLAAGGRSLVVREYSWGAVAGLLDTFLRSLASGAPAGARAA